MKLTVEQGDLLIEPGGWRSACRVPLADIDAWDLFYEVAGRRFLALHSRRGETHFVSLPRLAPAARASLREDLAQHLGPPSAELLDLERDNTHWQALWEVVKTIGRYLRLFINPRAPLR